MEALPKFDLRQLGTPWNIENTQTGVVAQVTVIPSELLYEVIKAHTLVLEAQAERGLIDSNVELVDCFTGFVNDPYDVTWYSSRNHTHIEKRAINRALKENNSIVVVEKLPKQDPVGHCLTTDK